MATYASSGDWNNSRWYNAGGMIRDDIPVDPNNDPEGVMKLACTGYSDCLSWDLRADKRQGVLFKKPLENKDSWASVGQNKTAGPPNARYQSKPMRHSFTMANGGIDWVNFPAGYNCNGFNGSQGWAPNAQRDLRFGTRYTGVCPSRFILNYCPKNLGTLVSGGYSNPDGGACDSGGSGCIGGDLETNLNVKCGFIDVDVSKFIRNDLFDDNLGKTVFSDSTWSQVKDDYCLGWAGAIDSGPCRAWFGTFGASSCNQDNCARSSYNSSKLQVCNGKSNWTVDTTCVSTINNIMKSGLPAEQTEAQRMVTAFCTANPTSPLCGCYNVTAYGSQCISDASKSTLPGCAAIKTDFAGLPAAAAVIGADKFCASSDCVTNALSSGTEFLPAARAPAQSCPPIQACIQNFQGAVLNNSEVSASCKQTLNISTAPAPAPGTPPAPPTGTPPSPAPAPTSNLPIKNPTVANVLDTSTKQYGAIGGLACIISMCLLFLIILAL